MEKAHKMQEKKKSISGRKTDKTGKPAIWQLRGRGFYAGNEKEEKNLQSVILDMVNRFGYLGILILIAVENVFPPIPSEVILTFGGFLTTCTRLHPAGVVLASTAAHCLARWCCTEPEPSSARRACRAAREPADESFWGFGQRMPGRPLPGFRKRGSGLCCSADAFRSSEVSSRFRPAWRG